MTTLSQASNPFNEWVAFQFIKIRRGAFRLLKGQKKNDYITEMFKNRIKSDLLIIQKENYWLYFQNCGKTPTKVGSILMHYNLTCY